MRDQIRAEGTLALRAGIAEGAVIMFEGDDYIGASVKLAARLCSAAAPGQILVASAGDVPARPDLSVLPQNDLPGLPAPVKVCELAPAGSRQIEPATSAG